MLQTGCMVRGTLWATAGRGNPQGFLRSRPQHFLAWIMLGLSSNKFDARLPEVAELPVPFRQMLTSSLCGHTREA